MGEKQRVVNVRVCRRVGGKDYILVCANCGNEVENGGSCCFVGSEKTIYPIDPVGDFCQWCGAPLKEAD